MRRFLIAALAALILIPVAAEAQQRERHTPYTWVPRADGGAVVYAPNVHTSAADSTSVADRLTTLEAGSGGGGTTQQLSGNWTTGGSQLNLQLTPGNSIELITPDELLRSGGSSTPARPTISVKTSQYQIVAGDENSIIVMNSPSDTAANLPAIDLDGDIPLGWTVTVANVNSQVIQVDAPSGQNIWSTYGYGNSFYMRGSSSIVLRVINSTDWLVTEGDLRPSLDEITSEFILDRVQASRTGADRGKHLAVNALTQDDIVLVDAPDLSPYRTEAQITAIANARASARYTDAEKTGLANLNRLVSALRRLTTVKIASSAQYATALTAQASASTPLVIVITDSITGTYGGSAYNWPAGNILYIAANTDDVLFAIPVNYADIEGETITAALEALTGNDRLDASAIKNLPSGSGGSTTFDPVELFSADFQPPTGENLGAVDFSTADEWDDFDAIEINYSLRGNSGSLLANTFSKETLERLAVKTAGSSWFSGGSSGSEGAAFLVDQGGNGLAISVSSDKGQLLFGQAGGHARRTVISPFGASITAA